MEQLACLPLEQLADSRGRDLLLPRRSSRAAETCSPLVPVTLPCLRPSTLRAPAIPFSLLKFASSLRSNLQHDQDSHHDTDQSPETTITGTQTDSKHEQQYRRQSIHTRPLSFHR